ncbi:MAG: ABC transporter permease [Caldimicrobium sp.]
MNTLKLKLLLGGILHKKLRLFLSVLGIIIGVSALFLMNTFGEAAKKKTLKEIETFGPDILMILPGQVRVSAGRAIQTEQKTTLKMEDAQALEKIYGIKALSPLFSGTGTARYSFKTITTMLNGVNESYIFLRKFSLIEGRNFLKGEITGYKKVAILGYKVKKELFGEESAEGKVILINKLPFVVIGVLSPIGIDASNQDQDDQILVPITTSMSSLFNADYLSGIYVAVENPSLIPQIERNIEELLLKRHRVSPSNIDFNIIKAEDIFKFSLEASKLFTTLVQSISILCLLVGSLGVTAIMLLSVNERKKEIGLRLAIGASRRGVLLQFLLESILITFVGGLVGLLIGGLLSIILLPLLKYPWVFPFKPIIVSSALTVFFGLISGVYPAYKASQIDPAILLKGL